MNVIKMEPRADAKATEEPTDRFDARLDALSTNTKRPVELRRSPFDWVRTQQKRQEA